MPISKTPEQVPFPLRADREVEPSIERFSTLPTALEIRQRYLFGIPLVSALTNEALSDDAIDFYIKAATSELEHTLDIYITPVTFNERHDYSRHDFTWSYNFMKLDHSPILNVEKLELSFTNDAHVRSEEHTSELQSQR